MSKEIIFAVLALFIGTAVSCINTWITAGALKKGGSAAAASSLIRSALNIGCLTAVFFIFKGMGRGIVWPLLGCALGLTVPSVLFAFALSKKMKGENKK